VFFAGRWLDATLHDRLMLPAGAAITGPALLVQRDSTTFVEPGYVARVHSTGHILIEAER
jgi:N-methylhydantoinase A